MWLVYGNCVGIVGLLSTVDSVVAMTADAMSYGIVVVGHTLHCCPPSAPIATH